VGRLLGEFAGAIEEMIAYSTHVFAWCNDGLAGRREDETISVILFRHFIELGDSIPPLVRLGIIDPCAPILRAMFEAGISIEYALRVAPPGVGYAFFVCDIHRRLAVLDSVDLKTEAGRRAVAGIRKDKFFKEYEPPTVADLDARREPLRELLQHDGYKDADAEFHRLRKAFKQPPKWYSFYKGPRSLEELANVVGFGGRYQIYYRGWSGIVHASHITEGRLIEVGGHPAFVACRQPFNAPTLSSQTVSMVLESFDTMLTKHAPSRLPETRKWYEDAIRARHRRMSVAKIVQTFARS